MKYTQALERVAPDPRAMGRKFSSSQAHLEESRAVNHQNSYRYRNGQRAFRARQTAPLVLIQEEWHSPGKCLARPCSSHDRGVKTKDQGHRHVELKVTGGILVERDVHRIGESFPGRARAVAFLRSTHFLEDIE